MTSPPRRQGDLATTRQHRSGKQDGGTDAGAEIGIEIGGAQLARLDFELVPSQPTHFCTDRLDQLHQRLDITDTRHIAELDTLIGQKRCGDDRQCSILVATRFDLSRQLEAALDHILHPLMRQRPRHDFRPS